MAARFVPGLELASLYCDEVVRPLLDREVPGLRYSAALIGPGSEVLGFDSARSTDHNWGPRLQLFLADDDAPGLGAEITGLLAGELPDSFRGYPTAFPDSNALEACPRHWVTVTGLGSWLTGMLGFDPRPGVTTLDWLATPTQRLAEITGGAVFHDGLNDARRADRADEADRAGGGLAAIRAALDWYPIDVWRYVLACQWQRIAQEEAFPGRCEEAGDELGSAVVSARLVRDLMRMCLLMRRRYPPYSKWLGTAFVSLPEAAELVPLLRGAVSAPAGRERQRCLCAGYEIVARAQNELGLAARIDPSVRSYYERPYRVLDAGRMADALRESIGDPVIRGFGPAGAVDQFIDSTDALGDVTLLRTVVADRLAGS